MDDRSYDGYQAACREKLAEAPAGGQLGEALRPHRRFTPAWSFALRGTGLYAFSDVTAYAPVGPASLFRRFPPRRSRRTAGALARSRTRSGPERSPSAPRDGRR